MRLEYFFDYSCPYAYLGSTQVEAIADACGAELEWKPMLLGGVFRSVGTPQNMAVGMSAHKARHNLVDMHRWAALFDVELLVPPGHPYKTVAALRALLSLPRSRWPAVIRAVYEMYWVRGGDVADSAVLRASLERGGVSGRELEAALAADDNDAIKDELRARTNEAIERGVFGAPSMFIDAGDGVSEPLYWGQDRLEMVCEALGGAMPIGAPQAKTTIDSAIDFYYDFSSPFAYLASTQIEAVAARAGAALRWKPFLLGALFKTIGTPDVPILAFSDAKRRYYRTDLHRWAERWQVPFEFSTRFPVRTVTALRLALLAGDKVGPLTHALFRCVWVEDRDISDDAVLRDVCESVGLDPDAVDATREPDNKRRLFAANDEAIARGVFGAPTSIVGSPGRDDQMFWGQDRLGLVERAAGGWHPELSVPKLRH